VVYLVLELGLGLGLELGLELVGRLDEALAVVLVLDKEQVLDMALFWELALVLELVLE
jgi:hypothetical protein